MQTSAFRPREEGVTWFGYQVEVIMIIIFYYYFNGGDYFIVPPLMLCTIKKYMQLYLGLKIHFFREVCPTQYNVYQR